MKSFKEMTNEEIMALSDEAYARTVVFEAINEKIGQANLFIKTIDLAKKVGLKVLEEQGEMAETDVLNDIDKQRDRLTNVKAEIQKILDAFCIEDIISASKA